MAIWNLGSVNIDHVYRLPHLPEPGETLAAESYAVGLGGKGANQSVAAARGGAFVQHLGAIGRDGLWTLDRLRSFGVGCDAVAVGETPTGHAIISVDARAENVIVLFPGANRDFDFAAVAKALEHAAPGDTLMLQNETAYQVEAAQLAQARGLRVVYSAAPFDATAVRAVLPYVTTLALNAVEAEQLTTALGVTLEALPVAEVLVTRGAEGADLYDLAAGTRLSQPSFPVKPVDTTAAGDTFAGYFVAALDSGATPQEALRLAAAAAAVKVTRAGAAEAIPVRVEVEAFLATQEQA